MTLVPASQRTPGSPERAEPPAGRAAINAKTNTGFTTGNRPFHFALPCAASDRRFVERRRCGAARSAITRRYAARIGACMSEVTLSGRNRYLPPAGAVTRSPGRAIPALAAAASPVPPPALRCGPAKEMFVKTTIRMTRHAVRPKSPFARRAVGRWPPPCAAAEACCSTSLFLPGRKEGRRPRSGRCAPARPEGASGRDRPLGEPSCQAAGRSAERGASARSYQ